MMAMGRLLNFSSLEKIKSKTGKFDGVVYETE